MIAIITWLYAQLLKLYPRSFYDEFSEEMMTIFQERLSQEDNALWIGIQEVASLTVTISRENWRPQYGNQALMMWQMGVILLIPALLGSLALLIRPVQIFFLPGKTWWILAFLTLGLIGFSWLAGRRYMTLALPLMGFMLSIIMRMFWQAIAPLTGLGTPWAGFSVSPIVLLQIIPYFLLFVILGIRARYRQAIPSYQWVGYLIALPVVGMLTGFIAHQQSISMIGNVAPERVFYDFYLGTMMTSGALAFIFMAGLLLAKRFGVNTILLMIGYQFSVMVGLAASLPFNIPQRLTAAMFLLMFFALIPYLTLTANSNRQRHIVILGGMILSYVILFIMQWLAPMLAFTPMPPPPIIATYNFNLQFWIYRIGELIQTLIMLSLMLSFYPPLQRIGKKKEDATTKSNISSQQIEQATA